MKIILFAAVACLLMWADNAVAAFVWVFLAGIEYERLRSGPKLLGRY